MERRLPVRCLVVCAEATLTAEIERAVERAQGVDPAGAVDPVRALAGLRPAADVVVVADRTPARALAVARELSASPACPPVLVAGEDGPAARDAMAAGARGVLILPLEPSQLAMTARAVAWPGRAAPAPAGGSGRVVAVCGAKGGVGTTFVSVALTRLASGLYVDLAPGSETAAHLGCTADRSLADLARLGSGLSAAALEAVTVEAADGLRLVPGVPTPELASLLPAGLAPALARECRAAGGWTALDIASPAGTAATEAVVCADRVLMVTTPDRLAAAAAARAVTRLVGLGVPDRSLGLVVNRWGGRAELGVRELEALTGAGVVGVVRDDVRAGVAFAAGEPTRRRRGAWSDLGRLRDRLATA